MSGRCLIEVVKFLTLEEALLRFQLTCKWWRSIATSEEISLHYLGDQNYLTEEQRSFPLPQRLKEAHQNLDFHDYLLHVSDTLAIIWNLPTDTTRSIKCKNFRNSSKYILNSKTTAIVTGGFSFLKRCVQIDLLTCDIRTLPDMCEDRAWHGITILRGEVYVSGGDLGNSHVSATAEKLTTEGWKMIPNMNQARYYHTLTTMQSHIYALGGWKDTYLDSIEKFDGESWTLLTLTLPSPRGFSTVVRQGPNLYLIGSYPETRERHIEMSKHWKAWTQIRPISIDFTLSNAAALRHRIVYFFSDTKKQLKVSLDNDSIG